jgi:hypothetical protein
LKRTLLLTI